MIYVLDAGPMIAFLKGEVGSAIVEDILTEPGSNCCAHIFNLCEVYYKYYRTGGSVHADSIIQELSDVGVQLRDDVDILFWKEAASFKARYPMALPDGFCLALARRLGGTAVTTDHKEFDPLVPLNLCPILFIR